MSEYVTPWRRPTLNGVHGKEVAHGQGGEVVNATLAPHGKGERGRRCFDTIEVGPKRHRMGQSLGTLGLCCHIGVSGPQR